MNKKYILIAKFDEDDGNYMGIAIKKNILKEFTTDGKLDDEQKNLITHLMYDDYVYAGIMYEDDIEHALDDVYYIMRNNEIEIYQEYMHTIIKQIDLDEMK
jgi:hypothetical protein